MSQQQYHHQHPAQPLAPVMASPGLSPTLVNTGKLSRFSARHVTFKMGVGGLFISTLLFIMAFSAPAWTGTVFDCCNFKPRFSIARYMHMVMAARLPGYVLVVQVLETIALICFLLSCGTELYQDVYTSPPPMENKLVEKLSASAIIIGLTGAFVWKVMPLADPEVGNFFNWAFWLATASLYLALISTLVIAISRELHQSLTNSVLQADGVLSLGSAMATVVSEHKLQDTPAGVCHSIPDHCQHTKSSAAPTMEPDSGTWWHQSRLSRLSARHVVFKMGVGGLFLSTLLFILAFSVPAWASTCGLWLHCDDAYDLCYSYFNDGRDGVPGYILLVQVLETVALVCFLLSCGTELYQDVYISPPPMENKLVEILSASAAILGLAGAFVWEDEVTEDPELRLDWAFWLATASLCGAVISTLVIAVSRVRHQALTNSILWAAGVLSSDSGLAVTSQCSPTDTSPSLPHTNLPMAQTMGPGTGTGSNQGRLSRLGARHIVFKMGVGGLFISTLLFILAFSVPAWTGTSGLWLYCSDSNPDCIRSAYIVRHGLPGYVLAVQVLETVAMVCFLLSFATELYQDVFRSPPPLENKLVETFSGSAAILGLTGIILWVDKRSERPEWDFYFNWGFVLVSGSLSLALISTLCIAVSRVRHQYLTHSVLQAAEVLCPEPGAGMMAAISMQQVQCTPTGVYIRLLPAHQAPESSDCAPGTESSSNQGDFCG